MDALTAQKVRFITNRLGMPAADVRRLFEEVTIDRRGDDEGGGTGPLPLMGWVPTGQLFVDPAYQRPITTDGWKRIRRIAAQWDWRNYQPITITGRNADQARLAIIDGQHRWEAAKLREIPRLPFYGISPGQAFEAKAFIALNRDRVAVSNVNIFWAELAARSPDAMAIKRICDDAGVTISPVAVGRLPARTVSAVAVLRGILKQSGEDVLARTLRAMAEAKPTESDTFGAWVLRGVSDLVAAHGGMINHDDLVRTLRGIDSTRLVAEVTIAARDWTLTRPAAMGRLLRGFYERASSIVLPAPAAEKEFHRKPAAAPARNETTVPTSRKALGDHKRAAGKTPGVRRLASSGALSAIEQAQARDARRAADQAMVDAAVKAGRITHCPTAAIAPTEGAAISDKDRKKLQRYRADRQAADATSSWRGPNHHTAATVAASEKHRKARDGK